MRFFLIDRITVWDVGHVAEAVKNIALSEDFFDDHFPRRPVMPGVLIIEGMAQLSGLLLEASLKEKFDREAKALLTILERTKFRKLIRPGDTLTYRAEVTSVNPNGGKASVQASCDGKLVVSTAMVFVFKYIDDPQLEKRRQSLLQIWMPPSE
jgi:3-hydroxyacyl-[acyl-carrier-protein] dehydratase